MRVKEALAEMVKEQFRWQVEAIPGTDGFDIIELTPSSIRIRTHPGGREFTIRVIEHRSVS